MRPTRRGGSLAVVPQNPPDGFPRITPYLLYRDVDAAVDFLVGTCGFTDQGRAPGPDGRTFHASVGLAGGVVMMGSPGPDYANPKDRGGATQLVYVYVDDVDAHHAAAAAAGATVLDPPADQFYGDRTYTLEDPEGHQWTFAQHTRDVAPQDRRP